MDQSSKHSVRSEAALDVDMDAAEILDEMVDDPVTFEGERTDALPDVDVVFAPDVVERSDLAIVLRPDAFPADPAVLIAVAEEEGATPEVLARLAQLPDGEYRTVGEVWEALGGPVEHRGVEAPEPAPVPTPSPEADDDAAIEAELDELDDLEAEMEAIGTDDLAELQSGVEAGLEDRLAELDDELDALEALDVDGALEPEPAPASAPERRAPTPAAPAPTASDEPARRPRHAVLAPAARIATSPLRLVARVLRTYAAALDRVADSIPGAKTDR